jgi:hypothetical protein
MKDDATKSLSTGRPRFRFPHVRVQFSLRSLLVFVMLAALALGLWLRFVEPYRLQMAAARLIMAAGKESHLTIAVPSWVRFFGLFRLPQHLHEIAALEMPPETTLACVGLLPRLTSLETLAVSGAAFGDDHLMAVSRHARLRRLTLRGTKVTPRVVETFRAARPDIDLRVESLLLSFDDLKFDVPPNAAFDRSLLTQRIRGIDGSPVRVKGYMYPNSRVKGVEEFILESKYVFT